ncbi:MAG: hypothetical protein C5B51_06835 [Terriglobia bacterium]|nr:MAG: hypothetical protein C5B51_06835 [Terriglobia bacterium]
MVLSASAQTKSYRAPRTPDGKPDLQGIWEARSTAYGNLEAHSASLGLRAGESVIVDPSDGKIPYRPEAVEKQQQNFKNRAAADPMNHCFLPGVPRVTYIPYPFQIFQTPDFIALTYEYVHASRTVHMNKSAHLDDIEFWMGDSRGRWEGETLVVDVADNNADTWFDMSGNFHSEALHVVERYTRTSPDTLQYEATIEDSKTFTRPWKISIPLFRHTEKNAQLYEYECHVYLEEAKAGK